MKALSLATLFMGFSVMLFAFTPPPPDTESCIVAPILTERLPNGVWLGETNNGKDYSVVFYENGLAQWQSDAVAQDQIELFNWEAIPDASGCAFLQLTNIQTGTIDVYAVQVVCNQLQLIDTDFSKVTLKQVKGQNLERKQKMLSGNWGNTTYPFDIVRKHSPDMEEAYLQYEFHQDGSFVRYLGNATRNLVENGAYMMSEDGGYILLQFDSGCVTVIALKYLEVDELVLQHVLQCEDPVFTTGRKDFFFNKI